MNKRLLSEQDIDSVRDIDGFPKGSVEDISSLSDAPFYTACPNPFIKEFIEENGRVYDKDTDDYHSEPYTSDVSEGKNDPFYMAHGYHTKVPYMAIMKYILHYTKPGDIVLDAFAGTGMTAVAALQCGTSDVEVKNHVAQGLDLKPEWGARKAIVSDISPIASFISYNYSSQIDMNEFCRIIEPIISRLRNEYGWVYKTEIDGELLDVNYTVWSDVYVCKNCSNEFNYWNAILDFETGKTKSELVCPCCGAMLKNKDMEKAFVMDYDQYAGESTQNVKREMVMIKYTKGRSQYKKRPTEYDKEIYKKVLEIQNSSWVPKQEIKKGDKTGEPLKLHIDRAYKYYSEKNLLILSKFYEEFEKIGDIRYKNFAKFLFSSVYSRSHKMNRYMPDYNRHVGPLAGTLYFPFFMAEINVFQLFQDKLDAIVRIGNIEDNAIVSTQSATDLKNIPNNSIDYIFTDPPFGDNIMYSELNYVNECWNKVLTNNEKEAIMNKTQGKSLSDYQGLMNRALGEYYRVLKPGRWITVEFHNSKNIVWNAIQEAINNAGFIVADVRTLDKKKGTTNQLSYGFAVKQDLVISAYKPRDEFRDKFRMEAGTEETAWSFVSQHLSNLPIVVDSDKNGKLDIIPERQAYLLFDRMVAFHIVNGIAIPMSAADFYQGLDNRYLKRDSMYFLPDQVNEYDNARIKMDIEPVQLSFVVTNEKTAIGWLYQQLAEPQTYADIQPKFMQEVKAVDKFEAIPELATILEENFLQDDSGKWYIPDISKEGDLAKLREKKLIREFESYMQSKGKLKLFRSEAIRAGFSMLWKDKNYKAIVEMAERLPEQTIQEDQNLLMYYDISLSRI